MSPTRRRSTASLAAVLGCAGAIVSSVGADARASTCAHAGYRLVQSNRVAALYESADKATLAGCLLSSHRWTVMTDVGTPVPGAPVRLVGSRAASVIQLCSEQMPEDGCDEIAQVFDLRTGKNVGGDGAISYHGLEITRRMLVTLSDRSGNHAYVVRATSFGVRTKARILAASPTIDPTSLAVTETRAYWVDNGVPQSAPV